MPNLTKKEEVAMVVPTPPVETGLTKEEQQAYLDVQIRKRTRWAVKASEVSSFQESNDVLISKVANRVYDDIISDIQTDKNMLKATRAVKFNVDYVARVIREGLAAGIIELNESAARELDNLTEGIVSADDIEERIHGITCLVARESLQR